MNDEALARKAQSKKYLLASVILLLLSCGIFYYRYSTQPIWDQYQMEKAQEESVRQQVDSLTKINNDLLAIIEENGKELVSFSEDKLTYINLASELSTTHAVRINKLVVSDVWTEGEMSVMTSVIEVEGLLPNITDFIESYCSEDSANRINVISCRPKGRYAWLSRGIDGQKVLSWFNLEEDEALAEAQGDDAIVQAIEENSEFGIPGVNPEEFEEGDPMFIYDPINRVFIDQRTGEQVSQELLESTPITLDKMFASYPVKVYIVVDFLGRA